MRGMVKIIILTPHICRTIMNIESITESKIIQRKISVGINVLKFHTLPPWGKSTEMEEGRVKLFFSMISRMDFWIMHTIMSVMDIIMNLINDEHFSLAYFFWYEPVSFTFLAWPWDFWVRWSHSLACCWKYLWMMRLSLGVPQGQSLPSNAYYLDHRCDFICTPSFRPRRFRPIHFIQSY